MPDYAARRTMMVDTQVRPSDVTKYPIIDAMLTVPREDFVPDHLREAAYAGQNLDVGDGRAILDPRTLAKMLDALNIQPTEMVLDVGCGLGYSTAVIARLAEAVVGVEADAGVAEDAQARLSRGGADNAAVVDGTLADGAAKHGPYDAAILQGAVEFMPDAILDQLAEGGRIAAIFADGALGSVRIGHKHEGRMTWRSVFNASAPVLPGFAKAQEFVL